MSDPSRPPYSEFWNLALGETLQVANGKWNYLQETLCLKLCQGNEWNANPVDWDTGWSSL